MTEIVVKREPEPFDEEIPVKIEKVEPKMEKFDKGIETGDAAGCQTHRKCEPLGQGIDNNEDEDEDEEEEEDSYDENDTNPYCFCRGPSLRGVPMVQCDSCDDWYHCICLQMTKEEQDTIDDLHYKYFCPKCRGLKFPKLKPGDQFYDYKAKADREKKLKLISAQRRLRRDIRKNKKRSLGEAVSSSSDDSDSEDSSDSENVEGLESYTKSKTLVKRTVPKGNTSSIPTSSSKRGRAKATGRPKKTEKPKFEKPKLEKPKPNIEEKRAKVREVLGRALDSRLLGDRIEQALFEHHDKNEKEYQNHCRGLLQNIKDKSNPKLRMKIRIGEITPEELVKMDRKQLASEELNKFREKVRKEIVKDSLISSEIAMDYKLGIKNRKKPVAQPTLDDILFKINEDGSTQSEGASKQAKTDDDKIICIHCGEEDLTKRANFCSSCGKRMKKNVNKSKKDSKPRRDKRSGRKRKRPRHPNSRSSHKSQRTRLSKKPPALQLPPVKEKLAGTISAASITEEALPTPSATVDNMLESAVEVEGSAPSGGGNTGPSTQPTPTPHTPITPITPTSPVSIRTQDSASSKTRRKKALGSGLRIMVWKGTVERESAPPAAVKIIQTNGVPFGTLPIGDSIKVRGHFKPKDASKFISRILEHSTQKRIAAGIVEPLTMYEKEIYKDFSKYYLNKGRFAVIDEEKNRGVTLYLVPKGTKLSSMLRSQCFAGLDKTTLKQCMLAIVIYYPARLKQGQSTPKSHPPTPTQTPTPTPTPKPPPTPTPTPPLKLKDSAPIPPLTSPTLRSPLPPPASRKIQAEPVRVSGGLNSEVLRDLEEEGLGVLSKYLDQTDDFHPPGPPPPPARVSPQVRVPPPPPPRTTKTKSPPPPPPRPRYQSNVSPRGGGKVEYAYGRISSPRTVIPAPPPPRPADRSHDQVPTNPRLNRVNRGRDSLKRDWHRTNHNNRLEHDRDWDRDRDRSRQERNADLEDGGDNRSKCIPCTDWKRGRCAMGRDCKYLHAWIDPRKRGLCRSHLMGECLHGQKCWYMHIDMTIREYETLAIGTKNYQELEKVMHEWGNIYQDYNPNQSERDRDMRDIRDIRDIHSVDEAREVRYVRQVQVQSSRRHPDRIPPPPPSRTQINPRDIRGFSPRDRSRSNRIQIVRNRKDVRDRVRR